MSEPQTSTPQAKAAEDIRDPQHITLLWRITRIKANILTRLGLRLKVYGKENVPQHGGVLMLSSHQSFLDPVLLAVQLNRPMAYLARDTLFRRGFAGYIRALNAFPVRQGRGDVGAMKRSIELLKAGWLLNIFPEGGRTEDGSLLPILPGAALVVKRAGVPVVPAIIDGAYDAWPRHRKLPRPGRVRVIYGPPLDLQNTDAREIVQIIDRRLHELREELRGMK